MNKYTFEELYIGLKEEFEVVITEEKMRQFENMSGDINPLHINKEYANSKNMPDRVVYGMLVGYAALQLQFQRLGLGGQVIDDYGNDLGRVGEKCAGGINIAGQLGGTGQLILTRLRTLGHIHRGGNVLPAQM